MRTGGEDQVKRRKEVESIIVFKAMDMIYAQMEKQRKLNAAKNEAGDASSAS